MVNPTTYLNANYGVLMLINESVNKSIKKNYERIFNQHIIGNKYSLKKNGIKNK